jgi:hypothetical protein
MGIIENIIEENSSEIINAKDDETIAKIKTKQVTILSFRSLTLEPINRNGGEHINFMGTNRIIVDNLPKGRTKININTIFGLTEIIVQKEIKIINNIVPVFSGIYTPNEINAGGEEQPELYITGQAVFGTISIKRASEFYKILEKFKRKIIQKIDEI